MEANGLGLNILLSNSAFLYHDPMQPFFTAAPPRPPNHRHSRTQARALRNPMSGMASLASMPSAPHRFPSMLLPHQMPVNPSPSSANASASSRMGPSTTADNILSRHARLLRRGTPIRSRPESSFMVFPMNSSDVENGTTANGNHRGNVQNDISSSHQSATTSNAVVGAQDITATSTSTGSVYDDPDLFDAMYNFPEWNVSRRGSNAGMARSFAVNGNEEGAGQSADRALEIMDDSEDEDEDLRDGEFAQTFFNAL